VKWRKLSTYTIESNSGYRVSKVIVGGVPQYEAWSPGGIDAARCLAARLPDADAGRQACERHASRA
jgi:hypothetical protein